MHIQAKFTRTYKETPLVVLDGGPFNFTEMTPEQLMEMATALRSIAVEAAKRPCTGKRFLPKTSTFEVA